MGGRRSDISFSGVKKCVERRHSSEKIRRYIKKCSSVWDRVGRVRLEIRCLYCLRESLFDSRLVTEAAMFTSAWWMDECVRDHPRTSTTPRQPWGRISARVGVGSKKVWTEHNSGFFRSIVQYWCSRLTTGLKISRLWIHKKPTALIIRQNSASSVQKSLCGKTFQATSEAERQKLVSQTAINLSPDVVHQTGGVLGSSGPQQDPV